MKITRYGATFGLVVAGALLLSACGSDTNTGTTATSSAANAPKVDCGGKKDLKGEGSTAQANAMQEFIAAYTTQCTGFNVAYNGTGSGAGVKQFNAGQVDFGGSDSPLSGADVQSAAARCASNPAWDLPMAIGPVAIAYNVSGLDNLVVNGELLAKIFSGQVKKWDDPAIKALNSSATLPSKDIVVFFRSEDSGTTDNFQKYLGAASKGVWTQGAGKAFKGGTGEGKAKSDGVTNAVKSTDGGITYVEGSFATNAKLPTAKIDSGSGPVALTDATAATAISSAKITGQGNDLVLDLSALYASNVKDAYPLVLVTYEIVCSKGYDADTTKAIKALLTVAASSGQDNLTKVGYVPLPQDFRTKLATAIGAIS